MTPDQAEEIARLSNIPGYIFILEKIKIIIGETEKKMRGQNQVGNEVRLLVEWATQKNILSILEDLPKNAQQQLMNRQKEIEENYGQ